MLNFQFAGLTLWQWLIREAPRPWWSVADRTPATRFIEPGSSGALLPGSLISQERSNQLLQVYREPLTPGREAEYKAIEDETASACADLKCPHPHLALHRADLSEDVPWAVAGARFFVATITRVPTLPRGVVFETDDGSRLVLAKAGTRAQADALAAAAGPNAVVLQIQPSWGMPAKDWIAADSDFWRINPSAAIR